MSTLNVGGNKLSLSFVKKTAKGGVRFREKVISIPKGYKYIE